MKKHTRGGITCAYAGAKAVAAAGLVAALGILAPNVALADDAPSVEQMDPAASASQLTDDAPAPEIDADTPEVVDEVHDVPEVQDVAVQTPVSNAVASFNGQNYATFDAALDAARNTDGATIELLADAQTKGLNLNHDLTIDGDGHTLKFTDKGIALWGHALTLKDVKASMTGVGSTPYTAEWNWMSVCASRDASLTLDNASLTMDGTGAGNAHAIYFCSNNKLNLRNGSDLTIKNYKQDALEWDGGDGGYNVNIEGGSTYTSEHNRSGFVGTFYVTVDASNVNVMDSLGNGSNGSHFDIKNQSTVNFSGNGSHGLSAGNLAITDSTVTCENNGLTGIIFTGRGRFTRANVQVTGTIGKSYWNAGIRLLKANASLDVDADSTVSVTGNQVTGLFLDPGARASFAEGARLIVTGNDASQANCGTEKELAQMGGGVLVRNGASLTLPSSAVIDNNNAALAGDDVFVEDGGSISFGLVNADRTLTEFDGCGHAIDAWYDDAAKARWSAHGDMNHIVPVAEGSYQGSLALKAAHGLVRVDYRYVGDVPDSAEIPASDEGLELGTPYDAATQTGVDGWTFDGWYTDEACTQRWEDGAALSGSMTLYGKWTKVSAEPTQPTEPQQPTTPASKPSSTKGDGKAIPQTGDAPVTTALAIAAAGAAAIAGGLRSRRRSK